MIKLGNKVLNPSLITRIIDREVFYADGKTEILTEPEIQDLFAVLFNERKLTGDDVKKEIQERLEREQNAKVDGNDTVPNRNRTNKPKRVSK